MRCACGNTFKTSSTKPELHLEICNNCHPFFTGRQKLIDTEGRVERFTKRFGAQTAEARKAATQGDQGRQEREGEGKTAATARKQASVRRPAAKRRSCTLALDVQSNTRRPAGRPSYFRFRIFDRSRSSRCATSCRSRPRASALSVFGVALRRRRDRARDARDESRAPRRRDARAASSRRARVARSSTPCQAAAASSYRRSRRKQHRQPRQRVPTDVALASRRRQSRTPRSRASPSPARS